jgi:hypothetical protein
MVWLHKQIGDTVAGASRWLHRNVSSAQQWVHKTSNMVQSARDQYARYKHAGLDYIGKRYGHEMSGLAQQGIGVLERSLGGAATAAATEGKGLYTLGTSVGAAFNTFAGPP